MDMSKEIDYELIVLKLDGGYIWAHVVYFYICL